MFYFLSALVGVFATLSWQPFDNQRVITSGNLTADESPCCITGEGFARTSLGPCRRRTQWFKQNVFTKALYKYLHNLETSFVAKYI